jgi:hypothetical protein
MPINTPPEPPATIEQVGRPSSAPIVDMQDTFARKTPQTEEDRTQTRIFIDGKIEMIRRDPHMTDAEKAAAIADLRSRR